MYDVLSHFSPAARRLAANANWQQASNVPPIFAPWRATIDDVSYCPLGLLLKLDGINNVAAKPLRFTTTEVLATKQHIRHGSKRYTKLRDDVRVFIDAVDYNGISDIKAALLEGLE